MYIGKDKLDKTGSIPKALNSNELYRSNIGRNYAIMQGYTIPAQQGPRSPD